MKFYKTKDNELYSYAADGSQDEYIKEDLILISKEEAEKLLEAKTESFFNLMPYTEKRANAYPPIADYIDGIVKGDQAQVDAYIKACLEVKAKYPKE